MLCESRMGESCVHTCLSSLCCAGNDGRDPYRSPCIIVLVPIPVNIIQIFFSVPD